nr:MAG TPA: hypothetical protein [Caudoviricetes sp.]
MNKNGLRAEEAFLLYHPRRGLSSKRPRSPVGAIFRTKLL